MTTQRTPKKPAPGDWHSADIKAALEKAGWSLRRLSAHHGLAAKSLQKCLRCPWPRAEILVADAIGKEPGHIWPSRYDADGKPKHGRVPENPSLKACESHAGTRESAA